MSTPWTTHRARAQRLRDRHLHAGEVLSLYLALIDVWEESWAERATAAQTLPKVVKATIKHGPSALAEVVPLVGEEILRVPDADLGPVERYLSRAASRVRKAREALEQGAAGPGRCPQCGGSPQLSHRAGADDRLVSGRRRLQCAFCWSDWNFSASTCPFCGETGAKRTVYAERQSPDKRVGRPDPGDATFPHIRIDGCGACHRYLLDIDLGLDAQAVPEVDELTALPLDLYATERGFSKITPNLMGF